MLMRTPHRWVRPKRLLPPGFIVPCQPTLAAKVPEGEGWLHELKHDGFRILAFKDGERVRLWSRNGRDWSADFVAIPRPCGRSRSSASRSTARRSRTASRACRTFTATCRRRAGDRVPVRFRSSLA
jgi:hypothetical protein